MLVMRTADILTLSFIYTHLLQTVRSLRILAVSLASSGLRRRLVVFRTRSVGLLPTKKVTLRPGRAGRRLQFRGLARLFLAAGAEPPPESPRLGDGGGPGPAEHT